MNTLFQNLLRDASVCQKFHKLHFFRQVNVTSSCILLIDRCNHDLISKDQLVFHAYSHLILRVDEPKGLEIHVII